MHARAIFVRGLFAVSRIYSRFVRAIARFQRKFSVNHAKSAYFQRKFKKSAQTTIYHINDARPAVEKPQWAGILRFQMDWNPLPMILLELTMVRVLPAQEIPAAALPAAGSAPP